MTPRRVNFYFENIVTKSLFINKYVQIILIYRWITLCVLIVVSPQRSNLVTAADVPARKRYASEIYSLDVETSLNQKLTYSFFAFRAWLYRKRNPICFCHIQLFISSYKIFSSYQLLELLLLNKKCKNLLAFNWIYWFLPSSFCTRS